MTVTSFSHTIVPTRVSATYRLGLAVVAVAMLLLPALYVCLIAATIWFVYWYLVTIDFTMVHEAGLWWVQAVVYLGPPFAGSVLTFFLVKPILARRPPQRAPLTIERAQAPALFDLIEDVCKHVRAPVPTRVQVDCHPNAWAGFLPGPLSIIKRDLVLTVGLPLVAALSIRDLAGVLAHEFGHFAQGGGLRLTWIIRHINLWFFRVVYERDRWDREFENWEAKADFRAAVPVLMARGCIWLSRKALASLLRAGHAISCFMLRQMEYDADSYEIKLAGSESFVHTMTRLRELNAGMQIAYRELSDTRALPSDLPQFVIEKCGEIPDDQLQQLRRTPDAATATMDTHPSDADRVRSAERAATAGALVGGSEPATSLFADFSALSSEATRHHYEHVLKLQFASTSVVANQDVIRENERRRELAAAVQTIFGHHVSVTRPLHLSMTELEGKDAGELRRMIADERSRMRAADTRGGTDHQRFEWLLMREGKAFAAEEVWRAGLMVPAAAKFDLASGTLEDARDTQAWAREEMGKLTAALDRLDRAASTRLACAIRLAGPEDGSLDMQGLPDAFNALSRAIPHAIEIHRCLWAQEAIRGPHPVPNPTPAMVARLDLLTSKAVTATAGTLACLGDTCHPLLEKKETLAAWLGLSSNVVTVDPATLSQRVMSLYWELLTRVAAIAQKVEDNRTRHDDSSRLPD